MGSELPRLINRWTGVPDASAECDDCGWSNENRKNALATGSVHARRTGHQVHATQTLSITYNRREGARRKYEVT